MGGPAVMFGIGATKAGTSWLHRYLADHPDCAMPALKELHYFDTAEAGLLGREAKRIRAKRARLAAEASVAPEAKRAGILRGVAACDRWLGVLDRGADDAAYLAFLTEGAGGRRLVGDVTPAYALLPEAVLTRMERLAPVTRFVYLLRDPVDRLWSHLRMIAARTGVAKADVGAKALAMFDDWAAGGHPEVTARGDYAAVLAKLGRAIAPANLWTGFYETLFSDAGVARLCAFLGIAVRPGRYDQRVHASPGAGDLTGARLALARARLAPQYDHVARAFGDLPARWHENSGIGAA